MHLVDRDQAVFTLFARVLPVAWEPDSLRYMPDEPATSRPHVRASLLRRSRLWGDHMLPS